MTAAPTFAPVEAPTAAERPALRIGRRVAAAALVLGAAGNTAEAVLGGVVGDKPEAVADQLRLVAEQGGLITTMLVAGTLAVPLMAVGFVATAQLLHPRAARTAWVAGSLLVAGMFGFLGMHVLELIGFAALRAGDAAAAGFLSGEVYEDGLLEVLFGQSFFVGVVAGMLLLCGALLVTGAVPRWIGACWLAFILLDFSIGSVGPVDPHWLFLAGAVGLAAQLTRAGARPGNA